MWFVLDGLIIVGLKQGGGAEQANRTARNVIGWEFEGSKLARRVHERPCNLSHARNVEAFCDAFQFDVYWNRPKRTDEVVFVV